MFYINVPNISEKLVFKDSHRQNTQIMWCARLIKWKHPELVIELAARLKNDGYNFSIYIYGDEGQLASHDKAFPKVELEKLIKKFAVEEYVCLMGSRPNSEVINAMCDADIFLLTSDKLEGWGAVANEAMSNGCALVTSDAIGSTGYLVSHKETGMIFKSGDIESLYEQVKYLIDNPQERERIAKAGRRSMVELWSPENAANSLLQLIEDLKAGRETSILDGPCSKA